MNMFARSAVTVVSLLLPVLVGAATDPYLFIDSVRYESKTDTLFLTICNDGGSTYVETAFGTITSTVSIDGKTDHHAFSGNIAAGDCRSFADVGAFSHFSGWGGIEAGGYEVELSLENTLADHSSVYTDITISKNIPPSAGMQPFSDIPSDFANYTAINYVKDQGIVSGYPDGTYRPYNAINRAEFTKIIIGSNFTDQAMKYCVEFGFSDTSRTAWYAKYICLAKQHEIIEGYSDGSFHPDTSINFVEAAKIIALVDNFYINGNYANDVMVNGVRVGLPLPASRDGLWYEPSVRYLAQKNAIPLSIESLDEKLTRGEMAEIIYRLKTGNTDKSSRTYEELAKFSNGSAAFSLPQYGFTLGAATPSNCTWKDLGPNYYQQQLDAGETISGTQPAARKVVGFHCPAFSIPDFTLNVYENHHFDTKMNGTYNGACGTQFGDSAELQRYIVPDGPGPSYLEIIQTLSGQNWQRADYCFNAGSDTMITLRWERKTFGALFADLEEIADSVSLQ